MKPDEKTYEQFIEEALLRLPLYNREWNDYSLSDPGITILENLTAFTILQQSRLYEKTELIQEALLKLAGFVRKKGSCAKVLLSARNVTENFVIPAGQQFLLGELIFETEKAMVVSGGKITGILCIDENGSLTDCTELTKEEPRFPVEIFTEKPSKNMEVWFFMDDIPEQQLIYYVKTENIYKRNALASDEEMFFEKPDFVSLKWECYTRDGFVRLEVKDETNGFLFDGRITFFLENIKPKIVKAHRHRGYAIRAVLKRADYDIAPRIGQITGFLFEVCQKKTGSITKTVKKTKSLSIYSDILEEEYYRLYKKTGDFYQMCGTEDYAVHRDGYGMYTFAFEEEQEEILLTAYTREFMYAYDLGMVYGYDNESMELPAEHIVRDDFSIIAEQKKECGSQYYLLYPDKTDKSGFLYRLEEANGRIRIIESGELTGCKLYLGSIAQNMGAEGNISAGKELLPAGYETSVHFINPAPGQGGCYEESMEEITLRYRQDIKAVHQAVCAEDYEHIVKNIPGLCINKVRAYKKPEDKAVHVAVRPASLKPDVRLSKQYKRMIDFALDRHRLLGTAVILEQPVYLPVHVYGKITVKEQYTNAEKIIKTTIYEYLDYIHSEKNFGEILKFDKVFAVIERLDCVASIRSLSIKPARLGLAVIEGVDICPAPNCLLYPGDIRIETEVII